MPLWVVATIGSALPPQWIIRSEQSTEVAALGDARALALKSAGPRVAVFRMVAEVRGHVEVTTTFIDANPSPADATGTV